MSGAGPARLPGPATRTVVVVAFLAACAVFLGYLWLQAGGRLPGLAHPAGEYTVAVDLADVDNLVEHADVAVAGVRVGEVSALERVGGRMRVTLRLGPEVTPLHEGVTVQASAKSLLGQPYLRLVDGRGPQLPSGTVLPPSAVLPSVQVHDVLAGLDAPTRQALGQALRSLGAATEGTRESLSQLMTGLGDLGGQGHTALDAIAAQSAELAHLAAALTTVFDALDAGHADLARLVASGNDLAQVTAGQRQALEATVRELPATLGAAQRATASLEELGESLAPLAADLHRSAPRLGAALDELPGLTRDLRALLPALTGVLDRAPETLDRVPVLVGDTRALVPQVRDRLRDLNPVLAYLSPYGREIGSLIANFGASLDHRAGDGGTVLRLFVVLNDQSVRGVPADLGGGVLVGSNPYPAPGALRDLTPFTGPFPRLYPNPN